MRLAVELKQIGATFKEDSQTLFLLIQQTPSVGEATIFWELFQLTLSKARICDDNSLTLLSLIFASKTQVDNLCFTLHSLNVTPKPLISSFPRAGLIPMYVISRLKLT